jgi:hypothetical protein
MPSSSCCSSVSCFRSWDGSVAILHLRLFGVCSPPVIHGEQRGRTTMAVCFKGAHFPTDVILTCVRLLCPLIFYTDLDHSRLLAAFGECQVIAQLVARRWFIAPLIHKDFRGCYHCLVSGVFASATLNHQMWTRALNRPNPWTRFADTPKQGFLERSLFIRTGVLSLGTRYGLPQRC